MPLLVHEIRKRLSTKIEAAGPFLWPQAFYELGNYQCDTSYWVDRSKLPTFHGEIRGRDKPFLKG